MEPLARGRGFVFLFFFSIFFSIFLSFFVAWTEEVKPTIEDS